MAKERPDFRKDPVGNLRYHAGGVKAYIDGPASRRKTMRTQWKLGFAERYVSPVIAVDEGDIRYFVDTSDTGPITVGLVGEKRWDEPLMERTLELITKLLDRPEPLKDRVFLDVGGNIGTATLCALKRFDAGRAVAFEPEPKNFKFLKLNIVANDLELQALPVQVAISDQPGELLLEIAPENVGDHRIRSGNETGGGDLGENNRETVRVEALTLDGALERTQVAKDDVGLIWIDVQGHEPQVLAGGADTLASGAPVLLEYWPYGLKRAGGLEAMHEQLRAHFSEAWEVGEERDDGPPTRVDLDALETLAERFVHPYDSTNLLLLKR
ncbi:MAG: FkbM family methyltransferase [Solirubrobacteraceae bacterium]|nr:FkbM family methyltransferase [Solirubrobacteraceae bacterium]